MATSSSETLRSAREAFERFDDVEVAIGEPATRVGAGRVARRVPGTGGWPRRCFPVSRPLASGLYGIMPTSKWAHAGITASSTDRSRRLYSFCAVTNLVRPRRARHPVGVSDLPADQVRRPRTPDLALTDQLRQCLERLLDRCRRVRGVQLIQVDPVGVEPAKAFLDGNADPSARSAAVPHAPRRMAELGGDHGLLAPSLERRAEHLLALSAAVDVGGVEEGDPLLERRVHDARRARCVDAAPEVVATEADDRRLEHASADGACLEIAHARQGTQRPSLHGSRRLLG